MCFRTYNDDEPHELGVGALSTFTGDDVPLLRRAHDDLSGVYLLFAELVVSRQLGHDDAVTRQALGDNRTQDIKNERSTSSTHRSLQERRRTLTLLKLPTISCTSERIGAM